MHTTPRYLLLMSLCLVSQYLFAQDIQLQPLPSGAAETAVNSARSITAADLSRHLHVIASDEMEGRETGTAGQKKAAEYLREQFKSMGLSPAGEHTDYFQRILFRREQWAKIALEVNGEERRHLWEYAAVPSANGSRPQVAIDELLFLGYGIDTLTYSDYRGAGDLTGKHILILAGEPRNRKDDFLVSGSNEPSRWGTDTQRKLRKAKAAGVATVFIIDADFRSNVRSFRKENLDGGMGMVDFSEAERATANVIYLTPALAKEIMGKTARKVVRARKKIRRAGISKSVRIPVALRLTQEKRVRELSGENVLGFLEGRDARLKEEVLIISAHYDHLGKRGESIFNGADDNGSGTSTVLEIAEAFTLAAKAGKGPRRSVLFLLVSGEEKGLLGSAYYAAHPVFPLEKTIADINVDMVGRVDEAHQDNPYYIYVIGADRLSTELHLINEQMNEKYTQLELDYTYNDEADPNRYYYRSDHYNFAREGIPSIFYFNGTHADYHRASDTVDKIDFVKMERIGRLVFHTAWQLANQDRRIEVDVAEK